MELETGAQSARLRAEKSIIRFDLGGQDAQDEDPQKHCQEVQENGFRPGSPDEDRQEPSASQETQQSPAFLRQDHRNLEPRECEADKEIAALPGEEKVASPRSMDRLPRSVVS